MLRGSIFCLRQCVLMMQRAPPSFSVSSSISQHRRAARMESSVDVREGARDCAKFFLSIFVMHSEFEMAIGSKWGGFKGPWMNFNGQASAVLSITVNLCVTVTRDNAIVSFNYIPLFRLISALFLTRSIIIMLIHRHVYQPNMGHRPSKQSK